MMRTIRNVNEYAQELPYCPMCGSLTELNEITIDVTERGGGGRMVAYLLLCTRAISTQVDGCTFALPLTWKQPPA